ncbi:hypothetical protein JGI25_00155 [Candidatus Kryptobacter tengchongensis]|uniref:Uncharacterized protein n=1 Tax=Kryptobacter tengchongensis TaxID=1643429 RepID=A0A916LI12_KRYT1|nr:hypothetical protein JGI25_00155 [Candidatus Kryptobacter tengchongensis]
MAKQFKIEDSPLFQITLPDRQKRSLREKQKKSRKISKKNKISTSSPEGPKAPLEVIAPKESTATQTTHSSLQPLPPEIYKSLLDKIVKHQTPTEFIVYSTLLKFSKITSDPTSHDNLIITEPISINKIAQICNIAFKTAKRAIRNLINKKHISIFNTYNSKNHKPTEYKIEHNILPHITESSEQGETWNQ